MIVLDTHIWIWWVHGDERLTQAQRDAITLANIVAPNARIGYTDARLFVRS